jgi:hypothetical protein
MPRSIMFVLGLNAGVLIWAIIDTIMTINILGAAGAVISAAICYWLVVRYR